MNQIRRILAANNIRTFSIISRATRLRKSTGTVGTIMAVKITGYLELIGIGLEHIWCRPLSFFFIASTCPTRQSCGHNLRYNLYNAEEERERKSGKYCVRGVQRCKEEAVPKGSGYIHQNAFPRGPHRKCKPVTFNWNSATSDPMKFDSCRWINCRASSIWVREQF